MAKFLTPDSMHQAVESLLRLEETTSKTLLEMLDVAFRGTPVLEQAIAAAKERIDPLQAAEEQVKVYESALESLRRGGGVFTQEALEETPQRSAVLKGAHDVIVANRGWFEETLKSQGGRPLKAGDLLMGFLRSDPAVRKGAFVSPQRDDHHELFAVTVLMQVVIEDDLIIDEETAAFLKEMLKRALGFSAGRRNSGYSLADDFEIIIGNRGRRGASIHPSGATSGHPKSVQMVKKLIIPPTRSPERADDDPRMAKCLYGILKSVVGEENGLGNRYQGARFKDSLRQTDTATIMVETILGDEAGTIVRTYEEFISALARAAFKKILIKEIVSLSTDPYKELVEGSEKPWEEGVKDPLERCRRFRAKEGQPQTIIEATESAELESLKEIKGEIGLLLATQGATWGWIWRLLSLLEGGVENLEKRFEKPSDETMALHDLYRTAELLQAEGKRIYQAGEQAIGAELVALADALFIQFKRLATSVNVRGTISELRDENPIEAWDRGLTHVEDEVRRSLAESRGATVVLDEARSAEEKRRYQQWHVNQELEGLVRGCNAALPRRRDTATGEDQGPIRSPGRSPVLN